MIEIERDGRIGIDLKFGTLTFERDTTGSFVVALVDVIVRDDDWPDTRVQMKMKLAAEPAEDTIIAVTEKCRRHMMAVLRAAAATVEKTTADALLFDGWVEA